MSEKPRKCREVGQDGDNITLEFPNTKENCYRFVNALILNRRSKELTLVEIAKIVGEDLILVTLKGPRPGINGIRESINKDYSKF